MTNTKQEPFTSVLSHGMYMIKIATIIAAPSGCIVNQGTFTLVRLVSTQYCLCYTFARVFIILVPPSLRGQGSRSELVVVTQQQ